LILLPLCFCSITYAEGFNVNKLYIGGGASSNRLDGCDNATGYQLFAGYDMDLLLGPVTTAIEMGYMDSGDFDLELNVPGFNFSPPSVDAKGLWSSANFAYPVTETFEFLARIGYDFGDDDGVLFGFGAAFSVIQQLAIRGEYISRQETDSLQINLVYSPDWLN
jgi:hypothetical protein